MFTEIDKAIISLFQKIVVFMDHIFCVSRRTLILGFVGVNIVFVLLYLNYILKTISYLMSAKVPLQTIVYSGLILVYLVMVMVHVLTIVLGLEGKDDEDESCIEEMRSMRCDSLFSFLFLCLTVFHVRYISLTLSNFSDLVLI